MVQIIAGVLLVAEIVWLIRHGPDGGALRRDERRRPGHQSRAGADGRQGFAGIGALATGKLAITVNDPDGSNTPGQLANVMLIYPYDSLTAWFPFSVSPGSAAQEVIAF